MRRERNVQKIKSRCFQLNRGQFPLPEREGGVFVREAWMAASADTANMKDEGPRHLAGAKRCGIEVIAAPTLEVWNDMDNHAHVKHPKELIQEANNRRRRDNRLLYYNDVVLEWITNRSE